MLEPFRRRTHSRALWLVAALIVAEALALVVSTGSNPFPATRFSFAVALLILISGVLPALLLPNIQSVLAACFAVVLASVLVLPFDPAWLPSRFLHIDTSSLPRALILRLVNAALLGPIALHVVACLGYNRLANRALGSCYGLTIALIILVLLVPGGLLRNGGAVLLLCWTLGLFAMALGLLFVMSRDPQPEQHRAAQQSRLLLIGVLLAELPMLVRPIMTRFGFDPAYNLLLVAQLILPLTITYAILQHDLFGVDAVLRRALAYAALSLVMLAVYFGLTFGLTTVLIRTMPQFGGIATVVGLFAAALAFTPAQRPVQNLIDRLFYPERLTFQNEVRAAQTRLAQVVARGNIAHLLTHDLPHRLGATWAWLGQTAEVSLPQPSERAGAWSTDLTVGGRALGRYWLGPRSTGLPYAADEQAQLQALTQQAALALAYAESFDALAALNRDLEQQVAARTEQVLEQQRTLAVVAERQRLARDMHDSVTQTLFSINLGARALRGLLQRDSNAAIEALDEQERAAQQALAEMRALLTQLRSPLLADGDLGAALRFHSALLHQQHGLVIILDINIHHVLSAPLAEALLQIAKEALHNIVKHSGVAEAQLRLAADQMAIVLEISDAGCGFDPAFAGLGDSFGLRGIRERVAALDGTLALAAAPGAGTTVRVRVPIGDGHD